MIFGLRMPSSLIQLFRPLRFPLLLVVLPPAAVGAVGAADAVVGAIAAADGVPLSQLLPLVPL